MIWPTSHCVPGSLLVATLDAAWTRLEEMLSLLFAPTSADDRAIGFRLSRSCFSFATSVVNPSTILRRDESVKIASAVPGLIVLRYAIICFRTCAWSPMGVFSASSSSTFTALVSGYTGTFEYVSGGSVGALAISTLAGGSFSSNDAMGTSCPSSITWNRLRSNPFTGLSWSVTSTSSTTSLDWAWSTVPVAGAFEIAPAGPEVAEASVASPAGFAAGLVAVAAAVSKAGFGAGFE